jgi:hypothetical protein
MGELLTGILQNLVWALLAWAAAWLLQQRKIRRLQQALRAFEQERGAREVALVLSAREDIREAVQTQLQQAGRENLPVFHVHHAGSFSENEKDWMDYVRQIKAQVQAIREHGATRIYLFTNVPVVMGVFAGALLDNGPEVIVHHYFNGVYRRVGSLTHETVHLG